MPRDQPGSGSLAEFLTKTGGFVGATDKIDALLAQLEIDAPEREIQDAQNKRTTEDAGPRSKAGVDCTIRNGTLRPGPGSVRGRTSRHRLWERGRSGLA
jgi:hypothetical protein